MEIYFYWVYLNYYLKFWILIFLGDIAVKIQKYIPTIQKLQQYHILLLGYILQ